jgi:hypothetical protein
LRIEFKEFQQGIRVGIDYNTDLFKQESVNLLLDRLVKVFESVTCLPDTIISDINFSPEAEAYEPDSIVEGFNFDFHH